MTKICIVDDHQIVRNGLIQIISDEADMVVTQAASNAYEAFDILKKELPDIIILDISMPGMNGYEALKKIKYLYPKLPVLMISSLSEEVYAFKSLKAGASGFFSKDAAPEELVVAIRKIINGGNFLSDFLSDKILDNYTHENNSIYKWLTDKEFQVLIALGQGKKVSEIASVQNLSTNTISGYRSSILKKFNFKNNQDIISYCYREKLVE